MNNHVNNIPPRVILWGAVGQAKLINNVIEHFDSRITAVFEDNPDYGSPFPSVPIYHGWDQFMEWIKDQDKETLGFALGIGGRGRLRIELHNKLSAMGLQPITIAHPSVVIAKDAVIGEGSQIMAGAIIGPGAKIGRQCIINANASIDHDNILDDGVEISPGAILCGVVRVGTSAWIAVSSGPSS